MVPQRSWSRAITMPGGRLTLRYKYSTMCLLEPPREKLKLSGKMLYNVCGVCNCVYARTYVCMGVCNILDSILHCNTYLCGCVP